MASLRSQIDELQARYDRACGVIDAATLAMDKLKKCVNGLIEERNILLSAIADHRKTLQHPTRVDRHLYEAANAVCQMMGKE